MTITHNPHAATAKPPIKICHLADIHLGYRRYNKLTKAGFNQREHDVNVAFQEAITRIAGLQPDATVIAGDLFHAVRPSNATVTFCFRQLRRLARETGAPVIICAGNHETPRRSDSGSVLQLFSEIEGVHVADARVESFAFRDRNLAFTCVPHSALQDRSDLRLRADDRFLYNVLVVHAQVNEGWVSDFGGVDLELKSLAPHEWDYIALGHVHLHRAVGLNAVYPGSIEHTSTNIWGEASAARGFIEIALPSGKRTFHQLTSPREVVVLEAIEAAQLEPQELTALIAARTAAVAGGVEGKILKLEVRGVTRECYRNLDHRELRALRARALNMTLDISFATPGSADRTAVHAPGRGLLRDQLLEFSKGESVPGISPEEIAATLSAYVAKVEAKYEAP